VGPPQTFPDVRGDTKVREGKDFWKEWSQGPKQNSKKSTETRGTDQKTTYVEEKRFNPESNMFRFKGSSGNPDEMCDQEYVVTKFLWGESQEEMKLELPVQRSVRIDDSSLEAWRSLQFPGVLWVNSTVMPMTKKKWPKRERC